MITSYSNYYWILMGTKISVEDTVSVRTNTFKLIGLIIHPRDRYPRHLKLYLK